MKFYPLILSALWPLYCSFLLQGVAIRQTIMERQGEGKAEQRLIFLHDYHKPDLTISIEQSKKIIDIFEKIKQNDPAAELLLERPEPNDSVKKISHFDVTLLALLTGLEHAPLTPDIIQKSIIDWLKPLLLQFKIEMPHLLAHDAHAILPLVPLIKQVLQNFIQSPFVWAINPKEQALCQLDARTVGVDGVRYLDYRVGVINFLMLYRTCLFLVPLAYNTPLYVKLGNLIKTLDIPMREAFFYIQTFIDETIARCKRASKLFPQCPQEMYYRIRILQSAFEQEKTEIDRMINFIIKPHIEPFSIADILIDGTRLLYDQPARSSTLTEIYQDAFNKNNCTLEAYRQLLFGDKLFSMIDAFSNKKTLLTIYDLWLADEIARSKSKTLLIVTGAGHAENMLELFQSANYKVFHDSYARHSNGLQIKSASALFEFENIGKKLFGALSISNYYPSATRSTYCITPTDTIDENDLTLGEPEEDLFDKINQPPFDGYPECENSFQEKYPEAPAPLDLCTLINKMQDSIEPRFFVGKLYYLLSLANAYLVGTTQYINHLDLKPLDPKVFDYALFSTQELKAMHDCQARDHDDASCAT